MNEKDDDYESDPEEMKNMRRRTVASDDEEEDEDEQVVKRRTLASDDEEEDEDEEQVMRRRTLASDDEEDDDVAGKYVEDDVAGKYVEDDVEDEGQGDAGEYNDVADDVEEDGEVVDDVAVVDEVEVEAEKVEGGEVEGEGEGEGGEKKENEPFAVPTAGAFYMHDDRFRGSGGGGGGVRGRAGGGRNRRSLDGRRLWETRDERKWGHDKFEEMSMHERPYNEGRRAPRGRNRGRGRGRGDNREFLHENRTKALDNNYQNGAPKSVRGRGPRRYRPATKNSSEAPANNRRPSKSLEKASHASTERASAAASTSEFNQVSSRRNTVASSLNSASPPFYPSASSNQEINSTQKGSTQTQTGHVSRSNNMRESSVSDTLGMEKLYIDNPGSSYQARNKGRGQTGPTLPGQRVYQAVPSHNQANRVPSQNQPHAFQQTPSFHPAGQQLRSRSASGSQASSTPKVSGPIHSLESIELDSYDSKMPLAGKGKGGNQNNGNSPFSYTGNIGGNHSDQNFPGAPTFLPVMQFAGQQHRGGIPAVGMAFPGYVGQPNGMGNSEMTWLPVLAGAARGLGATGAMGAAYPPYISMDGSYHAQTSGQASSLAPALSKDGDANEPGNKLKPFQRSELASDELGQRHNKARRYTEMKFDQ